MNIECTLNKLSKSKFRSSFKLKKKDIEYIDKKGLDEIRNHTIKFIDERISKSYIPNDGKQTPMKGHPTFIGQHATATCCRGCILKWHHIPKDKELTKEEKDYIVSLIMTWIEREYNDFKCQW